MAGTPSREVPLAAALVLSAAALFHGGGAADGSLWWLGGALLLVLVGLSLTAGVPGGWARLAPLALLAGWLALSIRWSSLPDRSWNYADRTLVYLLFAVLGLWLAGRTRQLALGLCVLLGAVAVWALAGKVLPVIYDYGAPGTARLRSPVGLWNQLALLAAFALPLALWRKRLAGTLLAYAWLVALALTYSRGGVAVAVLVVAAWLAFGDERLESAATLIAAAVPAAVVVGIAFALPGVTSDFQPSSTRWRDGLIFGALLLGGAALAVVLARAPRPRDTPALRRLALVLGLLALAGVIAVGVLKAGSFTDSAAVGNSSSRFTSGSSNFRTVWWRQALDGWEHHKLSGTGAGSFQLTNLRYRDSYLDVTIEPHSLPLQFLSEAGIVGLALLVAAVGLLVVPGARRARGGHELALALILPAFLVHSLIDIDWDFVAVSAPAFLVAGALAGRAPLRRVSPFATLAAAGLAALLFGALFLPWLGERWGNEALFVSPAHAVKLADRALSVDPLLVEPYLAKAYAAETRGNLPLAFSYYKDAVARQPRNPLPWQQTGEFAFRQRCYRTAYTYLERYTELDNKARADLGADDYRRALTLVNAGKGRC